MKRGPLLEKLVSSMHVNVAERQILGCVFRSEIVQVLGNLLVRWGRFPKDVGNTEGNKAGPIFEGAWMLLLDGGHVRITWQRHYANNPFRLAEICHELFPTINAALEAYIESEWRNDIDGIPLE